MHARAVVGGADEAAECLQCLLLGLGRKGVASPGFAHVALRTRLVALREQSSG
jgi:hypothetical protein